MPEKIHRKITITAKMLRDKYYACEAALDGLTAAGLLPITISTDPDENVELACRLVQTNYNESGMQNAGFRIWWLAKNTSAEPCGDFRHASTECAHLQQNEEGMDGEYDPTLAAQMLAMAADALLSERGL